MLEDGEIACILEDVLSDLRPQHGKNEDEEDFDPDMVM
jgi:hypothetical protein